MDFDTIDIVVNGNEVKSSVRDELDIIDINREMSRVASQIAWWGSIWAAAEQEAAESDAYYRRWRAQKGKELTEKNKDKMAEWKIKNLIESQDEFFQIKKGMAKAARNVIAAKTMCDAFKHKASMLQSKGAIMRTERESTSMHTKTRDKTNSDADRVDKKHKMKKIFKKK